MDQSAIQQGWERSELVLLDQQGDLNLPLTGLSNLEWNNVGPSQIATNLTGQAMAIGLKHSQVVFPDLEKSLSADLPLNLADTECQFQAHNMSVQPSLLSWPLSQSYQELGFGPTRHGYAYTALPASELPLNATDAGHFSVNVQSFQQNLFPQSRLTDTPNSCLIPYHTTNHTSLSAFKQPLTACPALVTQSLGKLHSSPRVESRRCVKCWALRKQVFLFI